jgi:hypothetical protein
MRMRIRIQLFTLMRIRMRILLFYADPDPGLLPWCGSGSTQWLTEDLAEEFKQGFSCPEVGRYNSFIFFVRIQRGDGGVQEHLLHCMGCGRAGQDQVKKTRNFHKQAKVKKIMQNIKSYLGVP